MIDPEKKRAMLSRIDAYYSQLIDSEFSGKVVTRFDRGHLQEFVTREQTDKLTGLPGRLT